MKTLFSHRLLVGTAFLMLVAGITYSCKDFLDVGPKGIVEEQTLVSGPGVEGTLRAAYRILDCTTSLSDNWGCAASNWVWGSVGSGDAYKGSEASDQPGATDIELYNWLTGEGQAYLNVKWRTAYEGVIRSNATLRLLRKVRQEKPTEIDSATAKRIAGEALFLRAHYHFEAYRMWQNIPYYYEDDTTGFRNTNVGVPVVANLLKDLDSAIVLLPATGTAGRANAWTARAYKGRVQVYSGDYNGALTTLRNVWTSGPYALETSFDHVWTGFSQFANGRETILAYQASANDGEPDGNNANYGERLNFPHSGSPFGCCGFHQPSQNLVNFFLVDSTTGLPLAVTNPAGWNTRDSTFDNSKLVPVDPRLDWTVGRNGVPFKDWGLHVAGWIRAPGYGGPYSPKKNIHERTSGAQSTVGWAPAQLNSVKIHLYRYADLLLLLAEANVEATAGGSLLEATTLVNLIRARAGRTAQGCGAGSTDTVLTNRYGACANNDSIAIPLLNNPATGRDSLLTPWAKYRIGLYPTFPDLATARTAIRTERRLELAMEGQRFFDLRRWAIDQSTVNAYLTVEQTRRLYLTGAAPFVARNHLYPIPSTQIELSKVGGQSTLQQNTGW
jgi:hypothetical protein